MKKNLPLLLILIVSFQNLNAQKLITSQDSMQVFHDQLFKVMKKNYIYKDSVNWTELESKVEQNLKQYPDFKSSLKEITTIFDVAKADHCKVYYNDDEFSGTYSGPTEKDFSEQWLKKFVTNPEFEVKVLDNQYGYILMPAMSFKDRSTENLHQQAQVMYDAINTIKASNNITGWIIDLRFNSGGDDMPMISALYDFLGDTDVWSEMNLNGKRVGTVKLKKGKYINKSNTVAYINPKGALLDKAKVAVITNIATASSGEITAMAFKGRDNTIFIGEKSNGKTTTNYIKMVAFGAYMTVSAGFDCDRNGVYYEHITPDIAVVKQDNFDDLLSDRNIQEAIKFITATP
ncbi:S41 family peptidase [Bizionia myxarmorum]|uniref:Peptidase S41 protein n=1 Tax=Bizionia myxarmorum TaxID=291186 RepID=A0A5D0R5B5_9FLAO|nr:S41 family peptidase [Bizionia myxarmorum]TYB75858.1 peptidase S41 protein [Bizionia myxarmorum]